MFTGVSDFGQSQDNINLIGRLRQQLFNTQRQITTGKKSDTYSGLSTQSQQVQQLRANAAQLDRFITGIDTVEIRTNAIETGLASISALADEALDGIRLQTKEGSIELAAIQEIARNNLTLLQDILNTEINGRYVFAGTDTGNPPYDDALALTSNIQSEVSDWLDGTQTIAQFLTDTQALSDTALGYNGTIAGAGAVYARIDQTLEVSYSVKADVSGIQDIMRALGVIANLQFPGAGDVGTESEFYQIIDDVTATLERGGADVLTERQKLSNTVATMQRVRTQHTQDEIVLRGFADDIENIDMAEAIAKLQQIEVQLQASFESTALANSLSLVNFI